MNDLVLWAIRGVPVVTLVLLAGCASGLEPEPIADEEAKSLYFPLSVGNTWDFLHRDHERSFTVQDRIFGTAKLNDRQYYLFRRPRAPLYLRPDEAGNVWLYDDGEESRWLLFDLPDGAIYMYPDSTISSAKVTVARNLVVETPAGTFTDCIRLEFDIDGIADDAYSLTFAPGVGIVERNSIWFSFPRQLTGFEVSGGGGD